MDSIINIIKKRISVRAYTDQLLSDSTINSILEAARYAPSARNLQQLEYKVITNKTAMRNISSTINAVIQKEMAAMPAGASATPQLPIRDDYYYNAPLLIIITGPRENSWIETDAGIAAQNMMLYATSINLGSCFIGMTRFIQKDSQMLRELHITEDRKIVGAVICGYPKEQPSVKEKYLKVEFLK